jgi:HlyD family secretion protein
VSPKKKKKSLKIWIIVGVVLIIGGLVFANFQTRSGQRGTKVDVALAELDSLVQTVTASGKIQPKIDVNISANVSGRILYLGAEEGHIVEKGQLLVQIEDEMYDALLQQTKYGLASSRASLDEARSQLKRVGELHTASLASDAQLEGAQATVKRFEADVDRSDANVDQAQDSYDKTRLYAPIQGTVTRLNKEIGEMAIGANFSEDVIMVVSRLEEMEVNVEVNENDVVLISLDDAVEIEVFSMPDTVFHGIVTEIAHSGIIRGQGSAEEVTNFNVTVAVLEYVPALRPGMSATVEIITERRYNTVVLPQEAVAVRTMSEEDKFAERARADEDNDDEDGEEHGGSRIRGDEDPVEVVFIASNDTVWARQVTLGIYSDTHFEILSGISEKDTVVTGPFRLLSRELHSGQLVEYFAPMSDEPESEEDDSVADSSVTAEDDHQE